MPIWLLPVLTKFILPIVLSILEKTGFVNAAEKIAIKAGAKVVEAAESLEATPDYPSQNTKGQK